MSFVLRTDKFKTLQYFAGIFEQDIGDAVCLTGFVFSAFEFDTEADAREAANGEFANFEFTVSEIKVGVSDNLK